MAFADGGAVATERMNNSLIFSPGDPPAVGYIPDPDLPKLFEYKFGREGYVVIPKGRIVAVNTNKSIKSPETGKTVNPITIADGTNKPIGVAPQNVYELDYEAPFDMVYGVITRDMIEVPLVNSKENADFVQWGCAWGDLKPGDFVKPDNKGHFTKWNEKTYTLSGDTTSGYTLSVSGDDVSQIVGRVYEIDTNLPPEGWLKWAEIPRSGDETDPALPIGYTPQQRIAYGGYPYDAAYRYGFQQYGPQGIPGLTNAANIEVTYVDEAIGVITAAASAPGTVYHFRLLHYPVVAGSVSLKVGGNAFDAANYTVDLASGLVTITLPAGWTQSVDLTVTATYSATGQIPGVPTAWDVKGAVGAVRILLMF